MKPTILLIGTSDRVAEIRVTIETFVRYHPGTQVFVCLVDGGQTGNVSELIPGEVFHARDLDIPDKWRFIFQYGAFELCCALKPFAARHVIDHHGVGALLYLDTDIVVTSELWDILEERWKEKDVLLTPHLLSWPVTMDAEQQRRIVNHGVINAGFFALRVSPRGDDFLAWWSGVLRTHCLRDYMASLSSDQKWLDLALPLPGVGIVDDPGINVAYWNLHERKLLLDGPGGPTVNDQPLRLFHFSGFDRETLTTKVHCTDSSALRLAAEYGRMLDKATPEGFVAPAYGWARYSDGSVITQAQRDLILGNDRRFMQVENPFRLPDSPPTWRRFRKAARGVPRVHISQQFGLLHRLYRHPVIGAAWKLWARWVNPSLQYKAETRDVE